MKTSQYVYNLWECEEGRRSNGSASGVLSVGKSGALWQEHHSYGVLKEGIKLNSAENDKAFCFYFDNATSMQSMKEL